jgi:hypothetical protein
MRKILVIAILTLAAVILSNIYTGSPDFITSASSRDNATTNEVVFSIPVGDKGIHYEGTDNLDIWGPPAFTIAPDGTFWIADTPDNHLLHFSTKGELLDKIATGNSVIGVGDLDVTSKEIWILDMASLPPKIVRLSLHGKVLSSSDLPKGFYPEDGLSGISVGSDGSVFVERMGGHVLTRFTLSTDEMDQKSIKGYEFQGNAYSAYPADIRGKDVSHGFILVGNKRIDVNVVNDLGGLRILHINSDGSFYVEVVELVLNTAFQVDQKVYYYDTFGNLAGMARVPLAVQFTPVEHGITVGPDGAVYAFITKPDGAEIQRLTFSSELPPILKPKAILVKPEQPQMLLYNAETCRSRVSIISVALSYLNNSTYINTYHINDNSACSGRVKPRYLENANNYSSVSYAWGMWDTVDQFNAFMGYGQNGYFAGNISGTYMSCARGIDCSGLVSRAWDLNDGPYGTCSLENVSTALPNVNALRSGDIMNRCSPTPRHTIIFDSFGIQGMWGYEATTYLSYDRVVRTFRQFSTISDYVPRRYDNVCDKVLIPVIHKSETEMDFANGLSNPYPSPESSLYSAPYLSPYP